MEREETMMMIMIVHIDPHVGYVEIEVYHHTCDLHYLHIRHNSSLGCLSDHCNPCIGVKR